MLKVINDKKWKIEFKKNPRGGSGLIFSLKVSSLLSRHLN